MSASPALPKFDLPKLEDFNAQTFRSTAYFPQSHTAEFAQYAAAVENFPGVATATNIPSNSDGELVPTEGFILSLIPMLRRADKEAGEEGFQLDKVLIAQLPALETLLSKPDFADYVYSSVFSSLENKLTVALKQETSLPSAVAEFVVSGRRSTADMTWREIGEVVKALRNKGIHVESPKVLRSILSSSSYATAMAPNTDSAIWERIIELCVVLAEKRGLPTDTLEHWAATRDETDLTMNISEDALSELEGLLGGGEEGKPRGTIEIVQEDGEVPMQATAG